MENPDLICLRFATQEKQYAIPNTVFSLPVTSTEVHLNSTVKAVLKDNGIEVGNVSFCFVLRGQLVCSTIEQALDREELRTEPIFEMEYFVKKPVPCFDKRLFHNNWVSAVCGNRDWILSGCFGNNVHLWSKETGEHKIVMPKHENVVKAVAFIECSDPIYTFVSTSQDKTAALWKWNQITNSVECVNTCKGHDSSVDCVDACEVQHMFATGSYDKTLKLWSSDIDEECTEGYTLYVSEGGDKKRRKTDVRRERDKEPVRTFSGHKDGVSGVQWIGTNEICTGSVDRTLRCWDVEYGNQTAEISSPRSVLDISYSPLARGVITASADAHVRLFDIRSPEGNVVKSLFRSHTGWVSSVKWSDTSEYEFVSGSYDTVVKLWDTRSTKASLVDFTAHTDKVLSVDFCAAANYIVSGGADEYLNVFTLPSSIP